MLSPIAFTDYYNGKSNASKIVPNVTSLNIYTLHHSLWGWGNSIMVSIFIYEAGHAGSSLARSICVSQKSVIYQHVIKLFPPVLLTGSTKAVHVLLID